MTDRTPNDNLDQNSTNCSREQTDEIVLKIVKKDGSPVTLEDVQKILEDKGIIDGKKITQKDVDQLFGKMEAKVTDVSTFIKFIEEIASKTKADVNELQSKLLAYLPEQGVSEAFKDTALNSIKDLQIKMEAYIATSKAEISLEKINEWFTEIFSNNRIEEKSSHKKETTNQESEDGKKFSKEDLKKFFDEISGDEISNVEEIKKKFNEWSKMKDGGSNS